MVTGGAGFIGSHLVDGLLSAGHEVGILDNFVSGSESNLKDAKKRVTIHKGSVTEEEFIKGVVREYDAVLHQAGRVSVTRSVEDPIATNKANADGTLNVLQACVDSGVKRFVYASSSSVYGDTPTLPKEESMPPKPISPYAVSKLAGELYCGVFAKVYGLKTVSLRYFNVYGPRQRPGPYSGVISIFMERCLAGEPPIIYGDGTQTRDFTFVKDAVQANLLSLEKAVKGGEVFNVATNTQTSLNQLAETICRLTGRGEFKPIHQAARPGDVMHSLADISRISKALGYEPRYNLESGLTEVVRWFEGEPITQKPSDVSA